jgi:AAA+ ATPase superfamily predicted ATPase
MKIAGRQNEIALLQSLLEKDDASFAAVYGRRRIGKTYLIRQVYEKNIVFECSGVLGYEMSQQLENFGIVYRLIDEYSLFYFNFLKDETTNSSWFQITEQPTYKIWSGYAFENLCFKQIDVSN